MNYFPKPFFKRVALVALGASPVLGFRLRRIAASGVLTVLNLHRVDDKKGSAYEAMQPVLFDELVGWLKKHFRILTFSDLKTYIAEKKPPLILSFDDGYKDFIDIVAPILAKHGVMANQNIIPACVDSGRPPMNVVLQDFIGTAPQSLLREVDLQEFKGLINPNDRIKSGMRASAALKNRPIAEQKTLFEKLEEWFIRFDNFNTTSVMAAEDIRQLLDDHEIGVHSFEHATMTTESDEYLRFDASRCHDWFSERFGRRPEIYAFPNGEARKRQIQITLDQGYGQALTVGEHFSDLGAICHPRFTMYASSIRESHFRALGGRSRIRK